MRGVSRNPMMRIWWISAAVCLASSLLLGAACLSAQGPLPGDVPVTRALQSVLGDAPSWAEALTRTAKPPWVWLTLCLAVLVSVVHGGWRVAAMPPLALVCAQLIDGLLRMFVYAPKPAPDLVAVATASASSGIPSTFVLVYGSLFGAILFSPRKPGLAAAAAASLCAGLIVLGACARLVLGGHWWSQVLASLLLVSSLVLGLQIAFRETRFGRAALAASRAGRSG